MTLLVQAPRIITALRSTHLINLAARTGTTLGVGSILRTGLGVLGVASVLDLLVGVLGFDDADADGLADMIEELTESGFIQIPERRRDGTESPLNWIHWNIAGQNDRPFYSPEYISRKFVAAVRRNERTPRYRGKPRPNGGRRGR